MQAGLFQPGDRFVPGCWPTPRASAWLPANRVDKQASRRSAGGSGTRGHSAREPANTSATACSHGRPTPQLLDETYSGRASCSHNLHSSRFFRRPHDRWCPFGLDCTQTGQLWATSVRDHRTTAIRIESQVNRRNASHRVALVMRFSTISPTPGRIFADEQPLWHSICFFVKA
jgi:hypothetical protein